MFDYMNITMFHGLGMLIFWLIIIFLFFSLFRGNQDEHKDSALNILKRCLAKGNINKEQFDALKESI